MRYLCVSNVWLVVATLGLLVGGARPLEAHSPAEAMAEAAQRFLASLSSEQRAKTQYDFDDAERKNWNFVPMERAGLPLKEMQTHQQQLAYGLLQSALSHRGLAKALNIMVLEQILHELENNNPTRDSSRYFFLIFGKPSSETTWGWRVEGHHLSVSLTLVDGQRVVATPSFYGANPAHVQQGPHAGLRVLSAEEDLARQLLQIFHRGTTASRHHRNFRPARRHQWARSAGVCFGAGWLVGLADDGRAASATAADRARVCIQSAS